MTKKQKKMFTEMSKELESYDMVLSLLHAKVNNMYDRINDSLEQNPIEDEKEKSCIEQALYEMDAFINYNLTALLSIAENLDFE